MIRLLALILCLCSPLFSAEVFLKDRLSKANVGDYLVTSQNKLWTVWLVKEKTDKKLVIEEIMLPASSKPPEWKIWVQNDAPYHTSWLRYTLLIESGQLESLYSFTQERYCLIKESQNFLSTLINLPFEQIPINERKKVGAKSSIPLQDRRSLWQPNLIYEGKSISNVPFDAYRATWPNDESELSGKLIEIYLPQESTPFPSYFPYWLQVYGKVLKANLHVIDSGSCMVSPKR